MDWKSAIVLGALALVVIMVVPMMYNSWRRGHLYRKHFGHPIDVLTVMSTERWDTLESLMRLLNAKAQEEIFSDRRGLKEAYEPALIKPFFDHISWLLRKGLIEKRQAWYDRSGNYAPHITTSIVKDGSGKVIGFDRDIQTNYRPQDEYRKTDKGGAARRLPDDVVKEDEEEPSFSGGVAAQ